MSQDFKIQQNVKVGNDDVFAGWGEANKVVPEGAQRALTTAGLRFLDIPGEYSASRNQDEDYLTLEAFNWVVINELESAGFRIVEK